VQVKQDYEIVNKVLSSVEYREQVFSWISFKVLKPGTFTLICRIVVQQFALKSF
jgi:hypothetical protein